MRRHVMLRVAGGVLLVGAAVLAWRASGGAGTDKADMLPRDEETARGAAREGARSADDLVFSAGAGASGVSANGSSAGASRAGEVDFAPFVGFLAQRAGWADEVPFALEVAATRDRPPADVIEAVRSAFVPGDVTQTLKDLMEPRTLLPIFDETRGLTEFTLAANALSSRLREMRLSQDTRAYDEMRLAAMVAIEMLANDPTRRVGERVELASRLVPIIFDDEPAMRALVLERVAQAVPAPDEPNASYAFIYRQLMDEYARQLDGPAFDEVAERWREADWPQTPSNDAWRRQLTRNIRARINAEREGR